jgi:hypothetical protein
MKSSRSKAKTWPYPRHRHFRVKVQDAAANWFSDRGLAVLPNKPYVLADPDDWPHNIILPEVADYIGKIQTERAKRGQGFPLHKSIHHGLSSQALLFNLIGPLIVRDDLGILDSALKSQGLYSPPTPTTAQFEYEDRAIFNEDYGQPVPGSLPTLIRSFKSAATRGINRLRGTPGGCVWQRGYYERVIRNERELNAVRRYIAHNPLRWELDPENPANQDKFERVEP